MRTPRQRPAHGGPGARQLVLDAALRLFNADGIADVSANRIAAVAGVSPGNLYYWFAGKDEIVAALFEQWSEQVLPAPADTDGPGLLRSLVAVFAHNDAVAARYGCLARELLPLLHRRPELAERYRATYAERRGRFLALAGHLADAGLLRRPEPPVLLGDAVDAIWVLSEFSPAFLAAVDEGTPRPSAALGLALLDGFLTPAGRAALAGSAAEARA